MSAKSHKHSQDQNNNKIKKTNQITNPDDEKFVMQSLLTLVIEKTLLEIWLQVHSEVLMKLEEDHNCSLQDCCDNPEYLKRVFCNIFGKAYYIVLESIEENLRKHKSNQLVEQFLKVMK